MSFDILVDYDDVVYPWSATAHRVCERAGITNGNQITSWHFWEDYGCTEDELWAVLSSATVTGELYETPLDFGVLEQMRRLRYHGNRLHIVTARGFGRHGELIQAMTREQIRNFNVPLDSLTFAKNKARVALELEVNFAIDDGVHNYEALTEVGVMTALMDAPHNQGYRATRVYSFKEFADLVLAPVWV